MAKITLKYVEKNIAKGRVYYRYRRDGLRITLPCDPTSPEFMEAYRKTHQSFETGQTMAATIPGSIAALIEAFRRSAEYSELKPRVRKLYLSNYDVISEKLGRFQAHALTRRVVLEWRDTFINQPAKANNLIKAISRLYSFGIDRGLVKYNPLLGVRKLKLGEWRPWKPEEIELFRSKAPFLMRLALDLALYTGQRLGDVVAMRWDHIHDDGIIVKQGKTGTEIWIPIHQSLQATLGSLNSSDTKGTILVSPSGQSYKTDHFKHEFKDASRKAGLPDDLVFHGLRKTAAVMLAEAGCSTEQIKSITGHRTDSMAAYYARQANQKVLAKAAMAKVEAKRPDIVNKHRNPLINGKE